MRGTGDDHFDGRELAFPDNFDFDLLKYRGC